MTYHHIHYTSPAHHLRNWLTASSAIACLVIAMFGPALAQAAGNTSDPLSPTTTPTYPSVLIDEVKTGGTNTTPSEYVILYNASDAPVDLTGWMLEYAKPAFPANQCAAASWKQASTTTVTIASLSGSIASHSLSQTFSPSMADTDAAGAVHLIDGTGHQYDLVGWGSATTPAPCLESQQAPFIEKGTSLVRYLGCASSLPIDSDDNQADFTEQASPLSSGSAGQLLPACTPPTATPTEPDPRANPTTDTTSPAPVTSPACQNVMISEIEPNPGGSDSGVEYIELRNLLTSDNDLSGCSLQTSSSTSKLFSLAGVTLAANEYRTFTDTTSGLTLPNANGGTVWLLNGQQELQSVTYPANMADDTAWAYADGTWGTSYTPTPNIANLLTPNKPCSSGEVRNPDTGRCVIASTTTDDTSLAACEPGKERNPETSRCRNIETASTPVSCPTGQERNPDTNRCRSIASATSSLTPCGPGQERNPDTNRCRAVTSSASTLAACPSGQERNPETNRCRKITAAASSQNDKLATIEDATGNQQPAHKPYWLIAVIILLGAIGYGVYEWRQELHQLLNKRPASFRLRSVA